MTIQWLKEPLGASARPTPWAWDKIEGVIQYIISQHVVLESKGIAAGFPITLGTIRNALETKNELQNSVRNLKKQLYENNKVVYNSLYEYIRR